MPMGFSGPQQVDRRLAEVARPVRVREDDRSTAVGDQAAVEYAQGSGYHPGCEHVIDSQVISLEGFGV